MITVHKRTARRLLFMAAAGAIGMGATIHAIPARADAPSQAAVFLGGTGTGMVPAGAAAPGQFITPWVSGPYKGLNMIYDGSPWATPQSSVAGLNAWIDSQRAQGYGPVTVVGLSKGAQVAQASMHASGAPQGVRFVLIGNPDRDQGLNTALGLRPKYGEVRSNVTDVYAQYDGFAEVPNLMNPLAVANAAMGMVFVHPYYGTGGEKDPLTRLDQGVTTVRDNLGPDGKPNGTTTTSVRIPTPYLPLTKPIRDTLRTFHLGTDGLDAFDAAIRPVIDAGYPKPAAAVPKADKSTDTSTDKNALTSAKPQVKAGAAGDTTPAKVETQKPIKRPSPKFGGPGNPVHDTIKTVQGALKQFAPKPKATQQKPAGGGTEDDAS